jgi:hypothetical protein
MGGRTLVFLLFPFSYLLVVVVTKTSNTDCKLLIKIQPKFIETIDKLTHKLNNRYKTANKHKSITIINTTLSSMRTISMELGCKKLGTSHNLRTLTLSRHPSLPGDTADTESNEFSIADFDIKRNSKLSSQKEIANCESE